MVKMTLMDCGSNLAIGIHGENEREIEERYNLLFNHQATNGEFQWMNEPVFGYCWSDSSSLFNAYTNICLMRLLANSETWKGQKGGALKEAKIMAQKEIDSLERERFLNFEKKIRPYQFYEPEIEGYE